MTYVSFCYLDAITGEPFDQRTSKGGPVMPAGCVFGFALESQYPTPTPTFYGTTSGKTTVKGILAVVTKAQYDAAEAAEMEARAYEPPIRVSAVQAKTALYDAGLFEKAEVAIGAHPYPLVRIWWASAQEWAEDHPYVYLIAPMLEISEDRVHALFVAAREVANT